MNKINSLVLKKSPSNQEAKLEDIKGTHHLNNSCTVEEKHHYRSRRDSHRGSQTERVEDKNKIHTSKHIKPDKTAFKKNRNEQGTKKRNTT